MNLEELLRLKRFEKPDEKCWEKFDAELESKMLLCIVEERGFLSKIFSHTKFALALSCAFSMGFVAIFFLARVGVDFFEPDSVIVENSQPEFTNSLYSSNIVKPNTIETPIGMFFNAAGKDDSTIYVAATPINSGLSGF